MAVITDLGYVRLCVAKGTLVPARSLRGYMAMKPEDMTPWINKSDAALAPTPAPAASRVLTLNVEAPALVSALPAALAASVASVASPVPMPAAVDAVVRQIRSAHLERMEGVHALLDATRLEQYKSVFDSEVWPRHIH